MTEEQINKIAEEIYTTIEWAMVTDNYSWSSEEDDVLDNIKSVLKRYLEEEK